MRVLLKFEIACDPDATWRAIHSPAVLAELYGPLLRLEALDALPTTWEQGAQAGMQLRAFGAVPVGKQLVQVTDETRAVEGESVRIMRDSGIPLSGPLSSLSVWDHRIAVSAGSRPDRTLWRERLVFAGRTAPVLWPGIWAAWQWRRGRIASLARSWAYDPEPVEAPLCLRRAALADADELAAVHVTAWEEAYRGRMPDAVLDTMSIDGRARVWRHSLADPQSPLTSVVALRDGRIVGFAMIGPNRDDGASPDDLELYALYVLASEYGRGTGQALCDAVLGDRAASLWVLEDNPRAQGFYRRNGFRPDGEVRIDERPGGDLREIRMVRGEA